MMRDTNMSNGEDLRLQVGAGQQIQQPQYRDYAQNESARQGQGYYGGNLAGGGYISNPYTTAGGVNVGGSAAGSAHYGTNSVQGAGSVGQYEQDTKSITSTPSRISKFTYSGIRIYCFFYSFKI
jgi:hypothetical protein